MSDEFHPVTVKLKKDAYIFVEGKQNADKFYIIKQGKVRIIREALTDETGSVLGHGEMFGLISTMAAHGYIESAAAVTDVTLLAVERKQYGSLIRKVNTIAVNSIKAFSQRLRELDIALSQRTLKNTASADPSHIVQIGEYYKNSGKLKSALYAYRQYLALCPDAFDIDDIKANVAEMENSVTETRLEYSPDKMIQKYPKEHLLFAEGETGHTMYIIQDGSVKITKIVDNKEIILAVLGKGDIFGEMALLEDKPRAATAEVYEDCTLLAVNRKNFSNLIKDQPDMVVRMATLMSERIWFLYRQLDNTFIENPLGRIYDALLIQLEKNRVDINSGEPYQCSFGIKELMGMAGMPESENKYLTRRVIGDGKLIFKDEKIQINKISDILKESAFYRRAQKIAENRKI
ncbi:Crp/Fnr family transcriptional regulator [Treponema sp. R80B11-R83G3]